MAVLKSSESTKMLPVPTLFQRDPVTNRVIPLPNPECEWVFAGQGIVSIKIDGIVVKVEKPSGIIKVSRMLKKPTKGQEGGVFCQCYRSVTEDRGIFEAYDNTVEGPGIKEGIYIAYGPGINGNKQGCKKAGMMQILPVYSPLLLVEKEYKFFRHGKAVDPIVFYNNLKNELKDSDVEGIVFHLEKPNMNPIALAQITRADFGFSWPVLFA